MHAMNRRRPRPLELTSHHVALMQSIEIQDLIFALSDFDLHLFQFFLSPISHSWNKNIYHEPLYLGLSTLS